MHFHLMTGVLELNPIATWEETVLVLFLDIFNLTPLVYSIMFLTNHNLCNKTFRQAVMPRNRKSAAMKDVKGEGVPPKQRRMEEPPKDVPSPLNFDSPSSLFQSLIAPLGVEEFFRDYWEKKPLHLQRHDPALAAYCRTLFQLSDLKQLCGRGLQYPADVNICHCVDGKRKPVARRERVIYSELKKEFDKNRVTIQFHQPQRFKVKDGVAPISHSRMGIPHLQAQSV